SSRRDFGEKARFASEASSSQSSFRATKRRLSRAFFSCCCSVSASFFLFTEESDRKTPSRSPYSFSKVAAVFGPTEGTPGMLSELTVLIVSLQPFGELLSIRGGERPEDTVHSTILVQQGGRCLWTDRGHSGDVV